jgi:predicted phage-related endonuclease
MNAAVAEAVSAELQADLAFREERRKYLGGSDIAALLGIAPPTWRRNTPLALYFDKIEPPSADTQGRKFKSRGKRWEGVVGEMLVEKLEEQGHKVEIVATNRRYKDPEFDFFACEIDWELRLDNEPELTNVELKTVHPFKAAEWGEEGTDASPVWYTAQGQWGWGITNRISPRRRVIIAVLFGADELGVYPVEQAPDLVADIRETARKFWIENVIARVPPPPGGLVDLARLFPNDWGRMVELADNEKFVDAIFELRAADIDFDNAKARWEAAEAAAKEIMGDAAIATIGGNKACSWKNQKDSRLDVTRLKIERPDIYNEFLREKEIRKFLLSRSKQK